MDLKYALRSLFKNPGFTALAVIVMALGLPFCKPTGYNLGKSGWVSATFSRVDEVPIQVVVEWIDESYRAVAPKGLVKKLDGAA